MLIPDKHSIPYMLRRNRIFMILVRHLILPSPIGRIFPPLLPVSSTPVCCPRCPNSPNCIVNWP